MIARLLIAIGLSLCLLASALPVAAQGNDIDCEGTTYNIPCKDRPEDNFWDLYTRAVCTDPVSQDDQWCSSFYSSYYQGRGYPGSKELAEYEFYEHIRSVSKSDDFEELVADIGDLLSNTIQKSIQKSIDISPCV